MRLLPIRSARRLPGSLCDERPPLFADGPNTLAYPPVPVTPVDPADPEAPAPAEAGAWKHTRPATEPGPGSASWQPGFGPDPAMHLAPDVDAALTRIADQLAVLRAIITAQALALEEVTADRDRLAKHLPDRC